MRIEIAALLTGLALWPAQAAAYENFIPLGHNYSPDDSVLPALNSRQDKVNAQVDIYEAEIYTRQRILKVQNSYFRRFMSAQENTAGSTFIDY